MEKYPSKKGWETIVGLPFDEKIARLRDADIPGFVKGVSETVHAQSVEAMKCTKKKLELFLDLPKVTINAQGDTLNEIVCSRYISGMLEASYSRSTQDSDHKVKEYEEVIVEYFVFADNCMPQWKKRGGMKDAFDEFVPAEEEVATFRTKLMEALVRRNERLQGQKKAGGKAIETLGVKGGFL